MKNLKDNEIIEIQELALKNVQLEAIKKFSTLKVGALFMEAGTGKTRAMLEILKDIDCGKVLWLTPFPSKTNLRNEIEKWNIKKDIEIVGIESIQASGRIYLELYEKLKETKHIIVVDESFKIKNQTSLRSKRISELGKLCDYRFVLNGTPVAKNYLDLHNQLNFLSPKILNMGLTEYKNTFIEYAKVKVKKGGSVLKKYEFIKEYHNLEFLYKLITPFIYDCDLELNKNKIYSEIKFNYSNDLIFEYKEYINNWEKNAVISDKYIEMTQKLQHLISIVDNKDELIKEIVDDKTIIFCKFVSTKEHLKDKFKQALVLTYQSGASSLNLQDYNKIIFYDKTFDYLQREQAEHRIYRTGQKENCYFYDLTGDLALDSIIDKNIQNKVSMNDYFKKLVLNGGIKECLKELKKKS